VNKARQGRPSILYWAFLYSLPPEVTSSATLLTFKHKLKTYLFHHRFPAYNISQFFPTLMGYRTTGRQTNSWSVESRTG